MEMEIYDETAQDKLWTIVNGYSRSLALRCAVQLGFADIIHKHGKPIALSELASRIPVGKAVDTDRLRRLMRYLVHLELFSAQEIDGELRYGLQPMALFLVTGGDLCMNPLILPYTSLDYISLWYSAKKSLELCDNPQNKTHGSGSSNNWDSMFEDPEKLKAFNELMACDTRLVMLALIKNCRDVFDKIGSLVDVGGGNGTLVRAIAKAFPSITCSVYDLPQVVADAPDYPEVTKVGGDMFQSIPTADAILLKYVLHDYNDEDCMKILKRCKEALPLVGGKVIIIDMILDMNSKNYERNMTIMSVDVEMMMFLGGKERTEEEWEKLLSVAGFVNIKFRGIRSVHSLIEAYTY